MCNYSSTKRCEAYQSVSGRGGGDLGDPWGTLPFSGREGQGRKLERYRDTSLWCTTWTTAGTGATVGSVPSYVRALQRMTGVGGGPVRVVIVHQLL